MSELLAVRGALAEKGRVNVAVVRELSTVRNVMVVSVDRPLKDRLRRALSGMRWQVREAGGGAEAMAHLEAERPEALLLDDWLPDLEIGEFMSQIRLLYPSVDLVQMQGGTASGGTRSPRRNELLHALREARNEVPDVEAQDVEALRTVYGGTPDRAIADRTERVVEEELQRRPAAEREVAGGAALIAEMVGQSASMRELARMIRLVAPRSATVLIEGETGTGKEVVAKALHRLSARATKSFTVLNCAAIPESLLEAELFGHTRGAFTGAVQSRTGRIEAAHGGTLFLDEIGEMPLALQAKMLRFLECGELQRVGDNETVRVDVRVIAATHQPLEQRAEERLFRLDLYHRLAVFPITVPALRERMDDLPLLVDFFMERMGQDAPRKHIAAAALAALEQYTWPGNVRELMHVLERGSILAGDRVEIGADEIRLRRANRL